MSKRKCCKPFSRGTTLLLVWSALINFASWSVRVNVIPLLPFPNEELNNFLSKGSSGITFTLTLQEAKFISALHTRRSVVPRENGLQHLRLLILLYNYLSSCGGNTHQDYIQPIHKQQDIQPSY